MVRLLKDFVPVVLFAVSVPFNFVVPATVRLMPPSVAVAPTGTVTFPLTLRVALSSPVKEAPLFRVRPPAPTEVTPPRSGQLAVPLTVNERQEAAVPFMVTVRPPQIMT